MAALDKRIKKYQKRGDIHFAICNSCFWCASYISANALDKSYLEGKVESIPIDQNEGHTFLY
jgi:hypothetical protein